MSQPLPTPTGTEVEEHHPLSDEALAAKELERQDRARASLERLGLAGQIAVRTSKYAPLHMPKASETSIPNENVPIPERVSTNDNVEQAQVTLLTRIWSVLKRVSSSLDQQLEYDEDQSLAARESRLEHREKPGTQTAPVEDPDKGLNAIGLVKVLAGSLGGILTPLLAPLAAIGAVGGAVSTVTNNPAIKKWEEKGGLIGWVGDKTGMWKGNPIHNALTGAAPGVSKSLQDRIRDDLKVHEGFKNSVYKDSKGLPTIGIGHLIKKGEHFAKRLTDQQVNDLFDKDFKEHLAGVAKLPNFDKLNDAGKAALANMAFNMGPEFWRKWKSLIKAMKNKDIEKVKYSIQHSKYWKSDLPHNKRRYRDMSNYVNQLAFGAAAPQPVQAPQPVPVPVKPHVDTKVAEGVATKTVQSANGATTVVVDSTQSTTGKTLSGISFGAELNARTGWARSQELRDLKTPGLKQQIIRPAPKTMPTTSVVDKAVAPLNNIVNQITKVFGSHKGQSAPTSVDSAGNVPSPSADMIGLSYSLYFHTGPDHQ
jgi:GH24 family phage-related lysozyme (muramidase)